MRDQERFDKAVAEIGWHKFSEKEFQSVKEIARQAGKANLYKQALELIHSDTFYEGDDVSVRHMIRKRADRVLKGESE